MAAEMANEEQEGEWEDLIGTGSVMKQVLVRGQPRRPDESGIDLEAPRKFFALIDIDINCEGRLIESHENFLINDDADLFPGAHLVIPLMDLGETSQYQLDPKFCFGQLGLPPNVPGNAKLECKIRLKLRAAYEEFLSQMSPAERLLLAERKKNRGKFWYERGDYEHAITIYQSLADLCQDE